MLELGAQSVRRMAQAVEEAYKAGSNDYWLSPLVLEVDGRPVGRIRAGDAVLFCCRRGERETQLTRAFVEAQFSAFPRPDLSPLTFVPLTLYHPDFIGLPTAFSPQSIPHTLGEVVAGQGLAQLRLAEEEKYAHITYFLSGGRAEPFPGEKDRKVPSSLSNPPQALGGLVDALQEELARSRPHWAALNVATGDILGHSGELSVKLSCAQAVDSALSEILRCARDNDYWAVITADHGLLEEHGPPEGPPNVSHTTNPVPFLLVGPAGETPPLAQEGILADVAPTVLSMLGLPQPEEMLGRPLLLGKTPRAKGVVLVVLDGWGLGGHSTGNPIALAHTPCWDELCRGPLASLAASGEAVGLLPGRKGNSEAGHMNLGAGRVVPQDEVRIQEAIESGAFLDNPVFRRAIEEVKAREGALHLLGLLSEQSSHGSMEYVLELLRLARREGVDRTYVHLITDGRSTQPGTAPALLRQFGTQMNEIGLGTVVTLVGRGLALDRGGDYTGKTERAYRALVEGTDARAVKA